MDPDAAERERYRRALAQILSKSREPAIRGIARGALQRPPVKRQTESLFDQPQEKAGAE